ncbi:MAG: hypothetical protein IPO60_02595 [Flavobacteriales bacterium]|nr:hypothetical protein [Flavobacteriales bacterium]MBK9597228.1 hypothetical protein [Flavobacteriales bacterium]
MLEEQTAQPSEGPYFDIPFEEFPLKVVGPFKTEEGKVVELSWATIEFDPNAGLTFRYDQDLADLPGTQVHAYTSNGQDLLLFRNKEGIPDKAIWNILRSHFFEYALQSNFRVYEADGPAVFDTWVLSGDALKGHSSASPTEIKNLQEGSIQLTVDSKVQIEGPVPAINAVLKAWVGFNFESSMLGGQTIRPVPEYVFRYPTPIAFDEVRWHEELFRELLDFIWCRGHGVPTVHLKLGLRKSRLLRKSVHVPNSEETYRALHFNRYLKAKKTENARKTSFVEDHLLTWSNVWFSMSDTERRPFIQAARLLKSPAMQTDLRFAGALHCLEALDKQKNPTPKPKGKPTFLNERLQRLSHRWINVTRPATTSQSSYLDRLAYTRNEIIHMEPHPEVQPGDLLEGSQITRAYYEAIVMIRASFLDVMGMPAAIGDGYAHSALKELALIHFRYS